MTGSKTGAPQRVAVLQAFLFRPGGCEVRALLRDALGWFVGTDVCAALGIAAPDDAIAGLDDDERALVTVETSDGLQRLLMISESGLHRLIFNRGRAGAAPFRRWITGEVMPALLRTGRIEDMRLFCSFMPSRTTRH
jgi:prophage antirepressor-like protein